MMVLVARWEVKIFQSQLPRIQLNWLGFVWMLPTRDIINLALNDFDYAGVSVLSRAFWNRHWNESTTPPALYQ